MRKHYIQPSTTIVGLGTAMIIASSDHINITVTDTEYIDEGRAKEDKGWSDIWSDDWSKE